MKDKKFRITHEVRYNFIKYHALLKLRDEYIKQNKHEMAKKIAYESEIQMEKSWASVYELYPKLKRVKIAFFHDITGKYSPGYVEEQ